MVDAINVPRDAFTETKTAEQASRQPETYTSHCKRAQQRQPNLNASIDV